MSLKHLQGHNMNKYHMGMDAEDQSSDDEEHQQSLNVHMNMNYMGYNAYDGMPSGVQVHHENHRNSDR